MSTLAPSPLSLPPGTVDQTIERLWPTPNPHINDPVGWIEDRMGEHVWSKQREICESIEANRHTAVQACHGPGKSHIVARVLCWWLDVHPVGQAFAVTTAPTARQVYAILWRYIRRAHRKAGLAGRITLDAQWYMGDDELVAYGRKPADYDPDAFQGIHERFILVLLDEGGGIPKALYDAVDSLATNENARVCAVGNPDDPNTEFEKVCRPGSGWNNIRISVFDTPAFTGEQVPEELLLDLPSKQWVEERKKRWGVGSMLYTSKVLGLFPEVSADTLISPRLIREAQDRELPGRSRGRYGADIARYGEDETVIYRNRGGVIRLIAQHHKKDTMETAGSIAATLNEQSGHVPVNVDVGGVGGGVYDRLREQSLPAHPFDGGSAAIRSDRFGNRRAEGYWILKEEMEAGLVDLDPLDEDLAAQLGNINYRYDSKGRIWIESKEDMKKRIARESGIKKFPSPDRADAVMMACMPERAIDLPKQGRNAARENQSITGDLLEREM